MTKLILKVKAVQLRKEGFSYNDIRDQIKVSKSTLSKWLSNLPFTPNQDLVNKISKNRMNLTDGRKRVKELSEKEAEHLADRDIGQLSKRDLFMLGLGIYMGEGSKTICLRLVNSDPTIIKAGIIWFRKIYGVPNENFMVRIHLYPDCDADECRKYWSDVTGLGLSQFHPVYVDRRDNKKIRTMRKLPFGTAHVTIRSVKKREFGVLLRRRILNSIKIAKNQAGLV